MRYLYGDSSESGIEIDYIDFVRGAVDFAVDVLLHGERITDILGLREEIERGSRVETEKLEALVESVKRTLQPAIGDGADGSVTACASSIVEAAGRATRGHVNTVESRRASELSRLDRELAAERAQAAQALERLVLAHPIPKTTPHIRVRLEPGGERYEAEITETTEMGLTWKTALDIPSGHALSSALRADRARERFGLGRLALRVPRRGGVFKKRTKSVPHRLGKEVLVELSDHDGGVSYKLREAGDRDQPGFDVEIRDDGPAKIRVARVGRGGEAGDPFRPEPGDADLLVDLGHELARSARELRAHRKRVVETKLDGEPFDAHPEPTELVHRLLDEMLPVVQEMVRRSASKKELVLKRLLGDDRREEVFVSLDELGRKLDRLPPAPRRAFAAFPFFHEGAGGPDEGDEEVTRERGAGPPPAQVAHGVAGD